MSPTERDVFEAEATIADWDQDYYHPIALRFYDRIVPEMLRLMGVEPGAMVLDAGCGPGVHSIRVARAGHPVLAIDISEAMLKEARQRVEQAGVSDKIEFRQEDLTALHLPDASYRYIFSWGVLIHIPEIERALDELIRILEPGGKLALYLTNRSALDHRFEALARFLVRKPLVGLESRPMGAGIWYEMNQERLWVWRIDAHALTRYLEDRGLRRTYHRAGEFTEIQRRVGGGLRRMLLRFNNFYHRLKLPPAPASANLLIFEKVP